MRDHEQEEKIRKIVRQELEADRKRRLEEETAIRIQNKLLREFAPHIFKQAK